MRHASAFVTLARLGKREQVIEKLSRSLQARSERERARAASACQGLVDRDAKAAAALLEPRLSDPSHDVRVALLPPLAAALAVTTSPDQLAEALRSAETNAMRRLALAGAFVTLAQTAAGREAAMEHLAAIANDGTPLARAAATLALGLITGSADGTTFLTLLVP